MRNLSPLVWPTPWCLGDKRANPISSPRGTERARSASALVPANNGRHDHFEHALLDSIARRSRPEPRSCRGLRGKSRWFKTKREGLSARMHSVLLGHGSLGNYGKCDTQKPFPSKPWNESNQARNHGQSNEQIRFFIETILTISGGVLDGAHAGMHWP